MMAAIGPIETMAANRPAMTISGKARSSSMNRLTMSLKTGCGVRLRAAMKEKGTAKTKPMKVETSATLSVVSISSKYSGM